jgi:uncharacterized membrane protein
MNANRKQPTGTAAERLPIQPATQDTAATAFEAINRPPLAPKLISAVCYIFGALGAALAWSRYRDDGWVRFHIFQSLFATCAYLQLRGLLLFVSGDLGTTVGLLISIVWFGLFGFLAYQAYSGRTVRLPLIGPLAEGMAGFCPGRLPPASMVTIRSVS